MRDPLVATVLSGLVGAVVAAIVAYGLRAGFEDKRRWHADRRQLYARFLGVCSETDRLVADTFTEDSQPGDEQDPTGWRVPGKDESIRLHTLEEQLTQTFEEIELIGSDELVAAAKALKASTSALTTVIAGTRKDSPENLRADWQQARERFHAIARGELNV